ncbi:MAG: YqgE/AlgH family protein [Proteobacteria bacterium]|nr:YqgE/AlgH family protein [Pseudomonadota bacterium]MCZ6785166.1 YqgE/AlgH family protein [Pseudomonadota bacterium]
MSESTLSASLLVAMPQLQDPNFRRAVVLLVKHDEDGTFGLVLNRPVDLSALNLCASLDVDWNGDPAHPIHWGGPVQPNTGWVVFNQGTVGAREDDDVSQVASGIYFAGSLDVLRSVAESPPSQLRLFLGYAGWGPGQLEYEMSEGAWLVAPLSDDVVFGVAAEGMWDHVVRGLGVNPATLVSTSGVH